MGSSTSVAVTMPRLSDSMEEGTIVAWMVGDGDQVQAGQEIAEIDTDKATMPYEAESAGPIHLKAAVGDTVDVGAVIAVIGDSDEASAPVSSAPVSSVTEADTTA